MNLLCLPGWPPPCGHLPASAAKVLGFQACTATISSTKQDLTLGFWVPSSKFTVCVTVAVWDFGCVPLSGPAVPHRTVICHGASPVPNPQWQFTLWSFESSLGDYQEHRDSEGFYKLSDSLSLALGPWKPGAAVLSCCTHWGSGVQRCGFI